MPRLILTGVLMILLSGLLSTALAAPVFIIEDGAPEIEDLVYSLEAHGHDVSVSSDFGFLEYEFTGDEVDLCLLYTSPSPRDRG